jgi:dUTP pyrophosphatase
LEHELVSDFQLPIIRLPHGKDLELPSYGTPYAAGMDLRAACVTPIILSPGERKLVPTGMIFEIPTGYEGQIRPRSGLAFKHGITCLNTPGTIDPDYRGEVMVLLINHGSRDFSIERGMRIAQMVVAKVSQVTIVETSLATTSDRGSGGFGSTGTK